MAQHDLQRLGHAELDQGYNFDATVPRLVLELHVELQALVDGHEVGHFLVERHKQLVEFNVQEMDQSHQRFIVGDDEID